MRGIIIAVGIMVIALIAAGLTEVTLAVSPRHTSVDQVSRLISTPKPTPVLKSSPTPSPVITPTPTVPTPTPVATPVIPQAVTNGFVHLRAQPNTSSAILKNLDGGTVVVLGAYRDSQWQGVTVDGVSGYIYRSYLNY